MSKHATKCYVNCIVCRCRYRQSKPNKIWTDFFGNTFSNSYMYSSLTICSDVFYFPQSKESRELHIPCFACYFCCLNTDTCLVGVLISFLGTDWKIPSLVNEVSKIVTCHRHRGENRKAALPPPPTCPQTLFIWLGKNHSLVWSWMYDNCALQSYPVSCYQKRAKISSVIMSCPQHFTVTGAGLSCLYRSRVLATVTEVQFLLLIFQE